MSEIFVVLGMHKSGTTLVSEMLDHSGIGMIENRKDGRYTDGNFYERECTKDINKNLLKCGNTTSLKVIDRLNPGSLAPVDFDHARRVVGEICAENASWGFKDPRTCLTYDFWRHILPPHRLICIYRRDHEVHAHYSKSKSKRWRGIQALRAWNRHNRAMLEYAESMPGSSILIDYSELMKGDAEFLRLERFVGRKLVDTRSPAMWRHNEPNSKFARDRLMTKLFLQSNTSATQVALDAFRRGELNREMR